MNHENHNHKANKRIASFAIGEPADSKSVVTKTPVKTTCPYCGVGCGVIVSKNVVGKPSLSGDKNHPANRGLLCTKGQSLLSTLNTDTRLATPLVKREKASWQAAINSAASKFRDCIERFGTDSVAFYVSGQLLTEDYYVANKLMKGFIGSANIDTNSRLCMSSPVVAHKKAFGSDTVPVNYSDLDKAQLILLVGSNLAWCHPILFQRIKQNKKENPKLKVVVIDPRETASCEVADLHLAINAGTDLVLFNLLLTHLYDNNVSGCRDAKVNKLYDTYLAAKQDLDNYQNLEAELGVPSSKLELFLNWFAEHEKVVTVFSQGINQSSSGVDNCSAIINCHLATGRIGKPGTGPFSITGQPNAMGGREVGAMANSLAAHLDFSDDSFYLLEDFWQTRRVARKPGLKAVDMFEQILQGKIKAIWIMATNPVATLPNSEKIKKALRQCPTVIVSEAFRTSETLDYADIVFPASPWSEKSGMVTNSERRISRQRAFNSNFAESQPDWWIICQFARAMGFESGFNYKNTRQIFNEHAQLSNLSSHLTNSFSLGEMANLSDELYDNIASVQWPQPLNKAFQLSDVKPFMDGNFHTDSKLANMVPVKSKIAKKVDGLILNSGRSRDQWHTMTRTGLVARLNVHLVEPQLLISNQDAKLCAIKDGSLVRLSAAKKSYLIRAQVSHLVKKGEVFAAMHWNGKNFSSGSINRLVGDERDPQSGQPALKQAVVSVRPTQGYVSAQLVSSRELKVNGFDYWVKHTHQNSSLYYFASDKAEVKLDSLILAELQNTYSDLDAPVFSNICLARKDEDNLKLSVLVINKKIAAILQVGQNKKDLVKPWLLNLIDQPWNKINQSYLVNAFNSSPESLEKDFCLCSSVGFAKISETIAQCPRGYAVDEKLAFVCDKSGAGKGCGSCVGDIRMAITAGNR